MCASISRVTVARRQMDADSAAKAMPATGPTGHAVGTPAHTAGPTPIPPTPGAGTQAKPRRYHGTVGLDPTRVASTARGVAEAVTAHLVGLVGANVTVGFDGVTRDDRDALGCTQRR
jgi:hypothetical protein